MKKVLLTPRIEYIDHAWKYFVNESYLHALQPYSLLCLCPLTMNRAIELAQDFDALLLCGGYDIASFYFHEPLHEQAHPTGCLCKAKKAGTGNLSRDANH